jgi:hypothetical protein
MKTLILFFTVAFFGVASPGDGLASDGIRCQNQGFSCANLVFQGFTYPYRREPGSYLYVNGGIYPYETVTDDLVGDSTVRLPDGSVMRVDSLLEALGLEGRSQAQLRPVIGYGSNPAPSQLARKFRPENFEAGVVIPVMKGTLKDFDVVWTPVFVSYGAMPATITPSPGTTVDVWVTWLDEQTGWAMNATEHANPDAYPLYVATTLEAVNYDFDGPDPSGFSIYVSCFGALSMEGTTYAVASVPALDRRYRPVTGPEMMTAVLPYLDGPDSVLELIASNVMNPDMRATRNVKLRPLGSLPDIPGTTGLETCRQSRTGPPKAY